ncbi:MAG: MATE family efflux transporter, partial [Spirochaetales bacterium]|nr:MATE family efflux transporter [Spirochaetales bacterium]
SVLTMLFLEPLLRIFGASEASLPYAKQYLSIILLGIPLQSIGFGMNNFIRAEGSPKTAMATMMIGAVMNIILDPLFIFVFDLGIRGAALATIIAQGVSSLWVLAYFLGRRTANRLQPEMMRLKPSLIRRIIAVGMAPFAMQLAASVIVALFNTKLLAFGGDTAISVFGIMNSVTMVVLMPIFGINQGAQPIIGYNHGAGFHHRVRQAVRLAAVAATAVVLVGFAFIMGFPRAILGLFNRKDPELLRMGVEGMRVFLSALPVVGFQIVGSGYFQALGKAKKAMFLSLSRQVLILVPALLILPRFLGLKGIWLTGPVSDTLAAVITAFMLYKEFRKSEGALEASKDTALPIPR